MVNRNDYIQFRSRSCSLNEPLLNNALLKKSLVSVAVSTSITTTTSSTLITSMSSTTTSSFTSSIFVFKCPQFRASLINKKEQLNEKTFHLITTNQLNKVQTKRKLLNHIGYLHHLHLTGLIYFLPKNPKMKVTTLPIKIASKVLP